MSDAPITLQREMTYLLDVVFAAESSSPDNPRTRFWQIKTAVLEGERIHARSWLAGIEWITPIGERHGRSHVRIPFMTDDGALVLLACTGLVYATDKFHEAVKNDMATTWDDQYMRMALTFETTAPRYVWLMHSLFIARGRLTAGRKLAYEVFRVG